jgi:polyhydroxybutyrate depolymerase
VPDPRFTPHGPGVGSGVGGRGRLLGARAGTGYGSAIMRWTLMLGLLWLGCGVQPMVTPGDGGSAGATADAGTHPGEDGGQSELDGGGGDDAGVDAGADTGVDAGVDAGSTVPGAELIAARPYRLKIPAGHDDTTPTPLVVLFHGYGASGLTQDNYFGLSAHADAEGFLLATPDGTFDSTGKRFWNATDACCNFENKPVDDVAYFHAIVEDVKSRHAVDPRRIFVIGHSNGGFMSHRLACDAAATLAGLVSLAGAGWADTAKCQPAEPVAVLQVHGTNDTTIQYGGGAILGKAYPSAPVTVSDWAARNGCASAATAGTSKDLVPALSGAETAVTYHADCDGGAAELWTIQGGGHIPAFNSSWASEIYAFLKAHPKP